jgi:hypothetical protein
MEILLCITNIQTIECREDIGNSIYLEAIRSIQVYLDTSLLAFSIRGYSLYPWLVLVRCDNSQYPLLPVSGAEAMWDDGIQ